MRPPLRYVMRPESLAFPPPPGPVDLQGHGHDPNPPAHVRRVPLAPYLPINYCPLIPVVGWWLLEGTKARRRRGFCLGCSAELLGEPGYWQTAWGGRDSRRFQRRRRLLSLGGPLGVVIRATDHQRAISALIGPGKPTPSSIHGQTMAMTMTMRPSLTANAAEGRQAPWPLESPSPSVSPRESRKGLIEGWTEGAVGIPGAHVQ